jgi:uncharacterized membrane protein YphA (DoxX/SURF4 family)
MQASPASRSIALARIVAGAIFACSGFAKVTGAFVRGGFAKSAAEMAGQGYPFWRPFLQRVVVPHPEPFAWAVALGELALGLSLLSGLLVRWASAAGIVLMASIGFGGAWPGPHAEWHQYVTAWLAPAGYACLFLIFAAADAGRLWGLDGRRRNARRGPLR